MVEGVSVVCGCAEPPEDRVRFECGKCGWVCETEVACMMHERSFDGRRMDGGRRECGVCGVWVARPSFARHVRTCRRREEGVGAEEREENRRTRGKVAVCTRCGVTLSYSNMARHQRSCRVWDPGGGPSP